MFYIALLIIILVALCVLHWYLNCRERAQIFWKIPGPSGAFLAGSCLQFFCSPTQIFLKLRFWANTYKNVYGMWVYPYGVINIYNPDDVETVISNSKNNEKSLLYEFVRPWLRDGLLISKGQKWQSRRKILTPTFHFNILRHFTGILEENSWKFVEKLDDAKVDNNANVVSLMSDLTLNSICETAMGTQLDKDNISDGQSYKNAIYDMGKLIIYRVTRSWLAPNLIFNLTEAGRKQKKVLDIIHNFPKNIIKDKREYVKKNGISFPLNVELNESDQVGPVKRRMAMLDLLISAEADGLISEKGIQEEVDTFMFEGHDTTAMGLSFILMELANNYNVQMRVRQELREVFGSSKQPATMQELANLKYLECCIKESLRLYPPVPLISRNITDSITLKDGYRIPSGQTLCHIHIFDLHRRADIYEDPTIYKPERFFPENCIGLHPYAYIPFSAGPRNCIGQKFAMLEMKSALSTILRNYELQPVTKPEELEFTVDLILRVTHPIYVKLIKKLI